MSKILDTQAAFSQDLYDYAKEQRVSKQRDRRSDSGRVESRAYAALVTMAGLAGTMGYAAYSHYLNGADLPTMANALFTGPIVAGTIAYIAHQAAPFRAEIADKLQGMAQSVPRIGAGFGKALSGLGSALGKLGDTLGLSSEARALKAEANYIKGILGVQSMGDVKRIARSTYGKHNANPVIHDAYWLRTGINTAVKDKLASGDKSPLSYNDIEMGILKNMDKANVLARSPEETRGHLQTIENVVLMIGNASQSNMDLKTGDFSKIKDNHEIKMLRDRDVKKGGSEPSPS
ncbi:hypothetical protein [Pseudomonas amygdali]|uniref:Uncharacterized protein n=3 Tax=Pseudomonas amygdali TaxID=47877 RepID=A0ABR5KQV6_PSEAV|nr:hypothetical protein [Pseudomonas amygdali]AXH59742.1 hypothetical protein PLA107_031460 [Pseudomonas amygdali pv. lachrymans str. M301315]KPC17164.1 Uncharacterized protein AC499_0366 [Pseudomonas amygdali pv. lachrymans]KPC18123.1 Uncharacterized protein AC499_1325 [Pseudomonas amygdali pv. lachrymans]RMT05705.1 hypothetical protein ALP54_03644 [Pseudomonas amygdali pv. lachrymans]